MLTVERMKQVRKERKMTQVEMAEALNISHVHYARMEQGGSKPSKSISFVFEALFPSRPVGTREDAFSELSKALEKKSTEAIWQLVEFLKRL